jgi:alpha-N-acetylglucosamine transferase
MRCTAAEEVLANDVAAVVKESVFNSPVICCYEVMTDPIRCNITPIIVGILIQQIVDCGLRLHVVAEELIRELANDLVRYEARHYHYQEKSCSDHCILLWR